MLDRLLTVVLAAFLLSWSPVTMAAPDNITRGELARLPEYCPDTQLFSKFGTPDAPTERQRRWVGMMGKTFWAMHHYCWALVSSYRAEYPGVTQQQREHLLHTANADCIYVLENSTPDFPLRPEVLLRMGQFSLRGEMPARALEYFEESRRAKPDYWPAYIGLHDANLRIGRRQAAADALRQGLAVMPGQPQLQGALDRLQRGAAAPDKASSSPRKSLSR